MFYILFILLIGVNFSPFLFPKLDIWHAQGFWAQICLFVAFSCLFFEKPLRRSMNVPLGLLHVWIAASTAFFCYTAQVNGIYDTAHFFPYFNFLCLLILYKCITDYLNRKQIIFILNALRYVIVANLIICVLQMYNLSQFFKMINFPVPEHGLDKNHIPSIVSGFIGNGTHLSGLLASCSPLFFWKFNREDKLILVLIFLVLTQTGTMMGDPAISGFIIFIFLCIYYFRPKPVFFLVTGVVGILLLFTLKDYLPKEFFWPQGRLKLWEYYGGLFTQYSVTGTGLGSINMMYLNTPFPKARHLHMEFFQYTFELGIIGGILIINLVLEFFKQISKNRLEYTLKALVIGFLISCCFTYPAHLWMPSVFVIFFYAAFQALNKEG